MKALTVSLQFTSAQGQVKADYRISKVTAGGSRMCGGIIYVEMNLGRVTCLQ